jgi:hypothetical protein
LSTYFGGINAQDYQQAWSAYTPGFQSSSSLSQWENGYQTTQESAVSLTSVTQNSDGSVTGVVDFTSNQSPSEGYQGQSCSQWSITYTLQPAASTTVIAPDGTDLSYLIDTQSTNSNSAC